MTHATSKYLDLGILAIRNASIRSSVSILPSAELRRIRQKPSHPGHIPQTGRDNMNLASSDRRPRKCSLPLPPPPLRCRRCRHPPPPAAAVAAANADFGAGSAQQQLRQPTTAPTVPTVDGLPSTGYRALEGGPDGVRRGRGRHQTRAVDIRQTRITGRSRHQTETISDRRRRHI